MRRVVVALLFALSGCNPTGGLADTADAALPTVKRYFDGAGTQVASGPWNRVVIDLDSDTLYHVGARRLDDPTPTFHLFGTDAQDGCQVSPNSGTWLMGKPPAAPFRVLPYLETMDSGGRGRLRFTTLDCQVQDLVLENAGRPYPRLYDHGYLVPVGHGYDFADPWSGETRSIAKQLTDVLVWGDAVLLWADDELKSYSEQFDPGYEWGNAPQTVIGIRDGFLVEDADGLHRVTLDFDSLRISSQDVLKDVCHVQTSKLVPSLDQGVFVIGELPCGNAKPSLLTLDATSFELVDSVELPFEADARHARAVLAGPAAGGETVPLGVAYLTDVDDQGRGTLWAWRADQDAPVRLGDAAELDALAFALVPNDDPWDGVAQVNYQKLGDYWAHDWLNVSWDGTTELIAERVVRNNASGQLLINFDGVSGDLPFFAGDGYQVLAKGLPPAAAEPTSYTGTHHRARIDHFDGSLGRVVIGTDDQPPSDWQAVGENALPDSLHFAWFMPALLFLENWDDKAEVGSLVAYNYELDVRVTIAEGVSSFDLTSYPWDGVVYAVPRGKNRGIWFSKAK